jgi:transcriptional regulator with XRE-family HTH domain
MTSETELLKAFGKQVAEIRKSRGLTQQQLASRLEMHITSIGLIESGRQWPRIDTLNNMAKVLNVGIVEFFRHTEQS